MRTVLIVLSLGVWAFAQSRPTLPVLHQSGLPGPEIHARSIGDMDNDGTGDLAVTRSGGVDVYSMGTDTVLYSLPFTATGLSAFDDINGDGVDEWLLGTSGSVYGIDGATGSVILFAALSSGGAARSLIRIDDIDGDGVSDFVVGAVGLEWFSGQTGQSLRHIPTLVGSTVFGFVNDLDGDGHDDVLAHVMSVITVATPTILGVFSSATGAVLLNVGSLGYESAGTIGDIDGDGFVDIAAVDNTRIDVLSGATLGNPGGPLTKYFLTVQPNTPTFPLFLEGGLIVGPAGDANGDGNSDWVIGQPSNFFPPHGIGSVSIRSGPTGAELLRHEDTAVGFGLGATLGGFLDANGDGFDDIVVTQGRRLQTTHPPQTPSSAYVLAITGTNDYGTSTSEAVMTWNAGPVGAAQEGSLDITDGLPHNDGALLASFAPAQMTVGNPSFELLVGIESNQLLGILPLVLDASGSASIPFRIRRPNVSGTLLYWQYFDTLSNGALASTNGVEMLFSK